MCSYATYLTQRPKEKAAKLIGNRCIILCKLNEVEIPTLLDTGAQVSIICLQNVKKYLKGQQVNKIEDLLGPDASLKLKTANWTTLPYLGWISVRCKLKGNSNGVGVVDLPMLVTESNIDSPIIGYNVLQELIGKYNSGSETDEIASISGSNLPNQKKLLEM